MVLEPIISEYGSTGVRYGTARTDAANGGALAPDIQDIQERVKNPTLSQKTRQGWGTVAIVMMFVGLRALKRAAMSGPGRLLSFRILAD